MLPTPAHRYAHPAMTEFDRNYENHTAGVRAEVVETINRLRGGELSFIEGVRALSALRFRVPDGLDSPDFLLFAAIDSETDHLPSRESRSMCSESWLEACDREVSEVAAVHHAAVWAACDRILGIVGKSS